MNEIMDQLRARAGEIIREGFDPRESLIDNLTEQINDEHEGKFSRRDVARVVDDLLLAYYAEQATWTGSTDCDRLDAAFAEMEARGIVARQHFTCCSNCGHSEIRDEIAKVKGHRKLIGYAFYHMQDTERAAYNGAIYIKFGTVGDTTPEAVGEQILDTLLASGLDAGWSGSADECVQVAIADWRKRRVNELPLTDEPE